MFYITALAYGIVSIIMAYAAAAMGDVLSVSEAVIISRL